MWPAVPAITFLVGTVFIVLLACLSPALAQDGDAVATFKSEVSLVRVDAQVVEAKNIVKGLTKDDFLITDEGHPQQIANFGHDAEPISLLLLFDISGSMRPYIEQISRTARTALGHLQSGDRVAMMVFANRTAVHQGFSDNLVDSAHAIGDLLNGHDVGVGTLINSSIAKAANYMKQHARPEGRRAILILTDNLSLSFRLSDAQVIRALDDADTVLNAIVVGRGIRPPVEDAQQHNVDFTPADVFGIAEQTGGEAIKADRADADFANMIERIRTRYGMSYRAPGGTSGEFRHIGVALSPAAHRKYPLAEVRARAGYYVK